MINGERNGRRGTAALLAALALLCASGASGASLELVGEARLKVWLWPIYESRLFCEDGEYRSGELPIRLEIEYLRNVRARDLIRHTSKEWEQQGLDHPRQSEWLSFLDRIWPDVSREDVLALEVNDDGTSTFFLNGAPLGSIDDAAFGRHFLDIWLSPGTSRPELRARLIGAED
jgi:hypothetical protein